MLRNSLKLIFTFDEPQREPGEEISFLISAFIIGFIIYSYAEVAKSGLEKIKPTSE